MLVYNNDFDEARRASAHTGIGSNMNDEEELVGVQPFDTLKMATMVIDLQDLTIVFEL